MKKVLITGALGQNGKILSKLYLKKRFRVFGFIKKKEKKKIKGVTYIIENLKKKKKIFKNLKKINPDIVIHLASINKTYSKRLVDKNFYNNYYLNLKITKNLVDSINILNLKPKFIFAGSSLMFKNSKKGIVSEKDPFKANDYYSKYKKNAFEYIKKKFEDRLSATTVLLFNHDSIHRKASFLIPKLVNAFKKNDVKFIKKICALNISGDFSHADDICMGIYKVSLLNKNIEKIILSSGKRFYINDLIKFLGKKFFLNIDKNEKNNKKNYKTIGSNSLARKIINYKPKKTLIDVCAEILHFPN